MQKLNFENATKIYEEKIRNLSEKQKTLSKIFAACLLVVSITVIIIAMISNSNKVVIRDLIGLTIEDATKILDEHNISYDFGDSIYDENAKNEQTVTRISAVWNSDGTQNWSYNAWENQDWKIGKGQKVWIYTEHITNNQQKEIDICKSRGSDYQYNFKNGKVECDLTLVAKKRIEKIDCEQAGKYWWNDSVGCITIQEANEKKALEEEKAKKEAEKKTRKEAEEKKIEEENARKEYLRKNGYIGTYRSHYNSKYVDEDEWTFNSDRTATFTGNDGIKYTLSIDENDYHKITAESYYMTWKLIFSEDWTTLKAINDFNGEATSFNKV